MTELREPLKLTVLPDVVRPVPVIVTCVPTGPDAGESDEMTGDPASGVAHIALLGHTKLDEITVNVNVLLVPLLFVTLTG